MNSLDSFLRAFVLVIFIILYLNLSKQVNVAFNNEYSSKIGISDWFVQPEGQLLGGAPVHVLWTLDILRTLWESNTSPNSFLIFHVL